MGVDFCDYNNDGLPDLIFTALAGEAFPLFRNNRGGVFHDRTWADGIGALSGRMSRWQVTLADFNTDGWKDVFTGNSHVIDNTELLSTVEKYLQPNSLGLNAGGRFVGGAPGSGHDMSVRRAHRGGAVADFDNDGQTRCGGLVAHRTGGVLAQRVYLVRALGALSTRGPNSQSRWHRHGDSCQGSVECDDDKQRICVRQPVRRAFRTGPPRRPSYR